MAILVLLERQLQQRGRCLAVLVTSHVSCLEHGGENLKILFSAVAVTGGKACAASVFSSSRSGTFVSQVSWWGKRKSYRSRLLSREMTFVLADVPHKRARWAVGFFVHARLLERQPKLDGFWMIHGQDDSVHGQMDHNASPQGVKESRVARTGERLGHSSSGGCSSRARLFFNVL